MTPTQGVRMNPYPGLRPFEVDEEYLFFGREAQIDELLDRLQHRRFLAVAGESGSGKSSLVRAGLLPALHGGFMARAGSRWRIATMRPGNDPIGNLSRVLAEPNVLGVRGQSSDLHARLMQAVLERGALGLVEAMQQCGLATGENLLIVADQFEELFRFAPENTAPTGRDATTAFVKLLLAGAAHPDVNVYVVITMRSDFLGKCARFRELPDAVNHGLYLIPRMTRDQLRRAIEGPAGVAGGRLTDRLVTRLLNDAGDDPDELPVLQHSLMRMWNLGKPLEENLDIPEYDRIGGMSTALSRHADEIFYRMLTDDRSRRVAEKLFKCLTVRASDNSGLRRPTSFRDACAITGASPEKLRKVVDAFRAPGCSFLMPPINVPIEEETILDISHESLMRRWVLLRAWVDEEAESAQIYLRLAEAASLHAQEKAALWSDPDLSLATEWFGRARPNAAWAARYHPAYKAAIEFLDASAFARDARAATARRGLQRLRLFSVATTLLLAVTVIGGYVAYTLINTERDKNSVVFLQGFVENVKGPVSVTSPNEVSSVGGSFRVPVRGSEIPEIFTISANGYDPVTIIARRDWTTRTLYVTIGDGHLVSVPVSDQSAMLPLELRKSTTPKPTPRPLLHVLRRPGSMDRAAPVLQVRP